MRPIRFVYLLLLVALAVAVTTNEASAQRRVRAGLVLGLASSTVSTPDGDTEVDRRTGVAIGATIDVPLATNLDLVTGVHYVQKGAAFSEPGVNFEVEFELDYLQIPALLRYNFSAQGVRPFLEGGGAFSFRMSCDFSASGGGFSVSAPCDEFEDPDTGEPTGDPVTSTDFSAIVGGGLDFGRALVGLRYDHGLSNLNNLDDSDTIKNRSFMIYTSIRLGR